MSTDGTSRFSAVDSSIGYLYQIRVALYWTLIRLKREPSFGVGVETLDDVVFSTSGGEPKDLLQTKHHRRGIGSLSDASPDLWRTLRIWFEGYASRSIPSTANLYLITTASAPDGSAASYLRIPPIRDTKKAFDALTATAETSSTSGNTAAYKAYLSVIDSDKLNILERVIVSDAAPNITDLEGRIREEVHWAVTREHKRAFLERLEGWWFLRVLKHLTDSTTSLIESAEVDLRITDLQDQFSRDALPVDDDLIEFTLDEATTVAHGESTFVKQLELIKAGKRRIASAIRDYYRAFEQRSRWVREDLIGAMDLHKYERRLTEEWELVFDAMRDELGEAPTEKPRRVRHDRFSHGWRGIPFQFGHESQRLL